jgi:hypothetical protein
VEGNDIGVTVHKHVACMFEGLLMTRREVAETPAKRRWLGVGRSSKQLLTEEEQNEAEMRLWRPNDLPIKSVIHMTKQLGIGVEVYTFLPSYLQEYVERWLYRKGASVPVYCYFDIEELAEDFKYNRDVHTLFTTDEEQAGRLGIRATVVLPDGTFGF